MHDKNYNGSIDLDECVQLLYARFGKVRRVLASRPVPFAPPAPNRVVAEVERLDADVWAERAQESLAALARDAVALEPNGLKACVRVDHLRGKGLTTNI